MGCEQDSIWLLGAWVMLRENTLSISLMTLINNKII